MYQYISKTLRGIINIILLVLFFVPFYWMALTSIKTLGQTLQFPPSFFVLEPQWINFVKAVKAIPFVQYLKNSIIVTLGILVLQMITVIPAAYAFARYEFKGKKLFMDGTFKSIAVVKPGKSVAGQDYVDGISGGTITSQGVQAMLFNSLNGYVKFLTSQN